MPSKLEQILRDAGVTDAEPTEEELTQYMPGTGNTVKTGKLTPKHYRENKLKDSVAKLGEFNAKLTPRQRYLRGLLRKAEVSEWPIDNDMVTQSERRLSPNRKAIAGISDKLKKYSLEEFTPEVLPEDAMVKKYGKTRSFLDFLDETYPGSKDAAVKGIEKDFSSVGYDGLPHHFWKDLDSQHRQYPTPSPTDLRHLTNSKNLPAIAEKGLKPKSELTTDRAPGLSGLTEPDWPHQTDRVFFSRGEQDTPGWTQKSYQDQLRGEYPGDEFVQLRPKKLGNPQGPDVMDYGAWQHKGTVPPQDLEIKLPDGTWEDLLTHMKKKP